MGFASRSVSIMRYRVKGQLEGSFWDSIHEGVKRGSFRTTDQPGELIGCGWTGIDDFDDYEFHGASYVRTNYVALAFRIRYCVRSPSSFGDRNQERTQETD